MDRTSGLSSWTSTVSFWGRYTEHIEDGDELCFEKYLFVLLMMFYRGAHTEHLTIFT